MIFNALVFGHMRRNGWRAALAIVALASSVAIVVVLDSAGGTLRSSLATANRATNEGTNLSLVAPPGGFDERLLARVRAEAGVADARPETLDSIFVRDARGDERRIEIRGVDLSRALPYGLDPRRTTPGPFVRDGAPLGLSTLVRTNAIVISRRLAGRLGGPHPRRLVDARDARIVFTSAATLADDWSALDANVAFVDLAVAQRAFSKRGRLDRIDCSVAPDLLEAATDAFRRLAPAGTSVIETARRAREDAAFASVVRSDLALFALLALVLGGAAIASALTSAVEARRRDIGIVRTCGVSRAAIFRTFLAEGALLGGIGSLVGLGLGALLAQRLVPDLFARVDGVSFEFAPLARAFACGVAAAIVAAILPARDAARTAPAAAMRGRDVRTPRGSTARPLAYVAGACVLVATLDRSLVGSFACILAAGACVPLSLVSLGAFRGRDRIASAPLALALGGLAAHARRTSVAVIALTLSIALASAVAIFADSLAATFSERAAAELPGDLRVSSETANSRAQSRLTARIAREIAADRDVATVDVTAGYLVVRARADADRSGLRRRLERLPSLRYRTIEDTRAMRSVASARSLATTRVAYGLVAATFAIALLGIATTFAALVFERRREIAILRYVGMTARGVFGVVLATAALAGALAIAIGSAVGLALGARTIAAIDPHGIGAGLTVHVPFPTLAAGGGVAFVCAVLAGIYPARLASTMGAAIAETP